MFTESDESDEMTRAALRPVAIERFVGREPDAEA
jgi:hypothetical protein